MSRIVLCKAGGELAGATPADDRAWQRFATFIDEMSEGETLAFSWSQPRSPGAHRAHFALIRLLSESQTRFEDAESLRAWLQCAVGHCDVVILDGITVSIPRSISFEALDEAEFQAHHARVMAFLRTARAARSLWPAEPPEAAEANMLAVLAAWESQSEAQGAAP